MLSELYEELIRCTQCNLCILGCPMFMATRYDHYSPRAIVILTREIVETGESPGSLLERLVFLCNLCRNCEVRCPSRIDITRIVRVLRRALMMRLSASANTTK